jgi:WXG100 family type VII secretion target
VSAESLRVVPADLAAAAQFADSVADQLVDRYSQTSEVVAALLDGGWKGSAADACAAAWQEWSDGFRLVVMGLRDEATAMQMAADQYVSTDGDSASEIVGT